MPYDMKDVIAATVDNGEYYEVQPFYATNITLASHVLMVNPLVSLLTNQK